MSDATLPSPESAKKAVENETTELLSNLYDDFNGKLNYLAQRARILGVDNDRFLALFLDVIRKKRGRYQASLAYLMSQADAPNTPDS